VLNDLICKISHSFNSLGLWADISSDDLARLPITAAHTLPSHSDHSNAALHTNTNVNTATQSIGKLRKLCEELGQRLRQCEVTTISPDTEPIPQGESWSHHIIAKIRNILTSDAEKLLHAFVISRLNYCNSLLLGCPTYSLKSLQLIQNDSDEN